MEAISYAIWIFIVVIAPVKGCVFIVPPVIPNANRPQVSVFGVPIGQSLLVNCTTGYGVDGSPTNNELPITCDEFLGWILPDMSCDDINECDDDPCGENEKCENVPGSYLCLSEDSEVDECTMNIDECCDHADCINVPGSYICTCKAGFTGDGRQCEPGVDECMMNIDECSDHADCIDVPGSYICTCKAGFTGDGRQCELTPCRPLPLIPYAWLYTAFTGVLHYNDQVTFKCDQGYQVYIGGIPTDQDHFSLKCGIDSNWTPFLIPTCQPIHCGEPSYVYATVHHGEELTLGADVIYHCIAGYKTRTGQGKFTRTCMESGEWSEAGQCVDIDECLQDGPNICGKEEQCVNVPGSYICSHLNTFKTDPCEFAEQLGLCTMGHCVIENDKAKCRCPAGYMGAACDIPIYNMSFIMSIVSLVLGTILLIQTCFIHIRNWRTAATVSTAPPDFNFKRAVYGSGLRPYNRAVY